VIEEGSTMTLMQEQRELGRQQPLSVHGKYLSLTTYRRDGTPVSTPVWFVEEDGRLFVITAAHSYKAKRLRRNPAAMVAPCTARGIPKGDAIPVEVEFLPPEEHARVDRLMAEKYRVDRFLILPIYRLVMKLRGKSTDERGDAYLSIKST
jgi:PPOX class probable F420-dependent enzyme